MKRPQTSSKSLAMPHLAAGLVSLPLSLLLWRAVPAPPGLDILPSDDERAEFDPRTDHEPLLR